MADYRDTIEELENLPETVDKPGGFRDIFSPLYKQNQYWLNKQAESYDEPSGMEYLLGIEGLQDVFNMPVKRNLERIETEGESALASGLTELETLKNVQNIIQDINSAPTVKSYVTNVVFNSANATRKAAGQDPIDFTSKFYQNSPLKRTIDQTITDKTSALTAIIDEEYLVKNGKLSQKKAIKNIFNELASPDVLTAKSKVVLRNIQDTMKSPSEANMFRTLFGALKTPYSDFSSELYSGIENIVIPESMRKAGITAQSLNTKFIKALSFDESLYSDLIASESFQTDHVIKEIPVTIDGMKEDRLVSIGLSPDGNFRYLTDKNGDPSTDENGDNIIDMHIGPDARTSADWYLLQEKKLKHAESWLDQLMITYKGQIFNGNKDLNQVPAMVEYERELLDKDNKPILDVNEKPKKYMSWEQTNPLAFTYEELLLMYVHGDKGLKEGAQTALQTHWGVQDVEAYNTEATNMRNFVASTMQNMKNKQYKLIEETQLPYWDFTNNRMEYRSPLLDIDGKPVFVELASGEKSQTRQKWIENRLKTVSSIYEGLKDEQKGIFAENVTATMMQYLKTGQFNQEQARELALVDHIKFLDRAGTQPVYIPQQTSRGGYAFYAIETMMAENAGLINPNMRFRDSAALGSELGVNILPNLTGTPLAPVNLRGYQNITEKLDGTGNKIPVIDPTTKVQKVIGNQPVWQKEITNAEDIIKYKTASWRKGTWFSRYELDEYGDATIVLLQKK